jgi:hypothetical protein
MSTPVGFIVIRRNRDGIVEIETFDTFGNARAGAEKVTRETGITCVIAKVAATTTTQDAAFNQTECVVAV